MCKGLQSPRNNFQNAKLEEAARLALNFWRKAPPKIKRIIAIAMFFLFSIIITVAGILTPLSEEEINILGEGLEENRRVLDSFSKTQQVSFIFGNNFMISLVGFIPIAGPIFECYVLYSTGIVLSAHTAYDETIQVSPLVVFFLLFLFPFTWLEFAAYSTAIAGSIWLTLRIIHHKGKREIKNTCILISICAVMLLVAAIIEAALI